MRTRKKIPSAIVRDLLVKSRRRCCLCFGINGDAGEKSGQIAHLDGDSANNAEDNLAFLCFDHHNKYDSITSQGKGLDRLEVVHYRDELYRTLALLFQEPMLTALKGIDDLEIKINEVRPFVEIHERRDGAQLQRRDNRALLRSLLGSIQGWYQEIIDGLASLKEQQDRFQHESDPAMRLGFAYVWRRHYLPNVVAISHVLEQRSEMEELIGEVDRFVELLTQHDWKDPSETYPLKPGERRYYAQAT